MAQRSSRKAVKTSPGNAATALRKQAEQALAQQHARLEKLSTTGLKKLVHELGTHQIELEMQNDQLRQAQVDLETSRNKYAQLYDFSPVGYFTIDARGLILETNRTGSEMLGTPKRLLLGRPFGVFVDKHDLARYEAHRKDAFTSQTRQVCELRIAPRKAPAFHARLQSMIAENVDDMAGLLRTAMIDISEIKRLEIEQEKVIAELQLAQAKIKTLTGFLPICAGCKKIRTDSGSWMQVEQYITEHSDAKFTHGLCPECYEASMTELKTYLKGK